MKNKTVSDATITEIITALDCVESATVHDRSNDPTVKIAGIKELKKLGISGRWKVIKQR